MPSPRRALGLCVIGAVGLIALVAVAYPSHTDSSVLDAYTTLEQARMPVEVVGWIQPTTARARLVQGGYELVVNATGLGEISIEGNSDAAALPADGVYWRDAATAYALKTTADPSLVRARITSVKSAEAQLTGSTLDTPLLYLVYLPVFAAFGVWAVYSLLRRP